MARNVTIGEDEVTLSGKGKGRIAATTENVRVLDRMIESTYGLKNMGRYFLDLFNENVSVPRIVSYLRYGGDNSEAGKAARQEYLNTFVGMDEFLQPGGAFFGRSRPEQEYLSYSKEISSMVNTWNLNENKYASKQKIASYIRANANPQVISQRIAIAASAVKTIPDEVKQVFRDYYNVGDRDLLDYYLDTSANTTTELQQKQLAAEIGQQAIAQGYSNQAGVQGVQRSQAEELASRGLTPEQAYQAFGEMVRRQSLTGGYGETLTKQQIEEAALGNEAAQQAVERVAGARVGRFREGGEYAASQRGVTGLGTTSV